MRTGDKSLNSPTQGESNSPKTTYAYWRNTTMKTEELKALGLTEEQIAGVFKLNGKSESKGKEELEKVTAERDSLADKLKTATDALKGFEGVDVADLKSKIETLQADLKAKDDDYNAKIADLSFNALLDNLITASGAKNSKATKALLDLETLKGSKNQKEDITAAIAAVKADNDYLFASNEPIKNAVTETNNTTTKDPMAAIKAAMGLKD